MGFSVRVHMKKKKKKIEKEIRVWRGLLGLEKSKGKKRLYINMIT